MVEISSNIWGTKFKIHSLDISLPPILGQVFYNVHCVHCTVYIVILYRVRERIVQCTRCRLYMWVLYIVQCTRPVDYLHCTLLHIADYLHWTVYRCKEVLYIVHNVGYLHNKVYIMYTKTVK